MSFRSVRRYSLPRKILYTLARSRVQEKLDQLEQVLVQKDRVLDMGCGNGIITEQLRARGYNISPVDIANNSLVPGLEPEIYNGKKLNKPDGAYDVALLVTVLHHTPDPASIVKEVSRVAKKVVIIEEVYRNRFERSATFFIDSLFNWEFIGHPHSNLTEESWEKLFDDLGLKVTEKKLSRSLMVLRRVLYVVERKG